MDDDGCCPLPSWDFDMSLLFYSPDKTKKPPASSPTTPESNRTKYPDMEPTCPRSNRTIVFDMSPTTPRSSRIMKLDLDTTPTTPSPPARRLRTMKKTVKLDKSMGMGKLGFTPRTRDRFWDSIAHALNVFGIPDPVRVKSIFREAVEDRDAYIDQRKLYELSQGPQFRIDNRALQKKAKVNNQEAVAEEDKAFEYLGSHIATHRRHWRLLDQEEEMKQEHSLELRMSQETIHRQEVQDLIEFEKNAEMFLSTAVQVGSPGLASFLLLAKLVGQMSLLNETRFIHLWLLTAVPIACVCFRDLNSWYSILQNTCLSAIVPIFFSLTMDKTVSLFALSTFLFLAYPYLYLSLGRLFGYGPFAYLDHDWTIPYNPVEPPDPKIIYQNYPSNDYWVQHFCLTPSNSVVVCDLTSVPSTDPLPLPTNLSFTPSPDPATHFHNQRVAVHNLSPDHRVWGPNEISAHELLKRLQVIFGRLPKVDMFPGWKVQLRLVGAESRARMTFEQYANEEDGARKEVRITFVSDGGRFADFEFGEAAVSLLELVVAEEMDWLAME